MLERAEQVVVIDDEEAARQIELLDQTKGGGYTEGRRKSDYLTYDPIPGNRFVEFWFALAGRRWTSLALVPADPGGSLADVAMEVAEAGKRVDEGPVIAFPIKTLDAFSARTIADFQRD